jgi:IS5 family transposase
MRDHIKIVADQGRQVAGAETAMRRTDRRDRLDRRAVVEQPAAEQQTGKIAARPLFGRRERNYAP